MYERVAGFVIAFFLLLPTPAPAEVLVMSDCWARASVPGARSAAIYGSFRNDGKRSLAIEEVTSEIAGMIMIHETVLENNMVMMSPVDELRIAPGDEIELKPGGVHMMLTGLTRALIEKDVFQIRLVFSDGSTATADVKVGSINQMTTP